MGMEFLILLTEEEKLGLGKGLARARANSRLLFL
jgi:hypothetical protein